MSVLAAYQRGFLEELEKIAAKPVKESRRAWGTSSSRKGRRPMRVSTMLKKEKDGSLGGYKFAELLEGFAHIVGDIE